MSFNFASTTCEMENCNIKITMNIAIAGADSEYMNYVKNEIETVWNGPEGYRTSANCGCPISFEVNFKEIKDATQLNCEPGPLGYHCIKVTEFELNPPSDGSNVYLGYFYTPGRTNDKSIVGWWSNNMMDDKKLYFAHEAGHLMGLTDDYSLGENIMGQINISEINQELIDKVVFNVCGDTACPNFCCCGDGEINENEACDPFASPNGCPSTWYCCPVCCECYRAICDAQKGEHLNEDVCNSRCNGECYKNYETGCYDCLYEEPTEMPSVYDNTIHQLPRIYEEHRENHKQLIYPNSNRPTIVEHTSIVEKVLLYSNNNDLEENMLLIPEEIMSHETFSKIFSNERIVINVDNSFYMYIITKDNKILTTGSEPIEDPTVIINTDKTTLTQLMNGEKTMGQAVKDKLITYEGVGIFSSIKLKFLDILHNVIFWWN